VIRGHPGGLFQFSGGGAIRIILAVKLCCNKILQFLTGVPSNAELH